MEALVLECIVAIVFGLISYYIIPILKDKKLYDAVVIAVKAAEQIYNDSGMGKEKFAYVSEWISKKFKISKDDLKNMIESAVYELNNTKTKE